MYTIELVNDSLYEWNIKIFKFVASFEFIVSD